MAGSFLNSTAVLLLNFCDILNICALNSATSPSCNTLVATMSDTEVNDNLTKNENKQAL